MKFSDQMVELMKYAATKFSTAVAKGSIRQYCKINFNKNQMKYLVKGNYVDENTLGKFNARTVTEIFRK